MKSCRTKKDIGLDVIWQTTQLNADGNVTNETLGANLTTARIYYPKTGLIDTIQTTSTQAGTVQNLAYQFDKIGNLEWRKDNRQTLTESFCYDELNRLTHRTLGAINCSSAAQYTYDTLGNITYKAGVGYYYYKGDQPHAVTEISPVAISQSGTTLGPGDANGDGVITGLDVSTIVNVIHGSSAAPGNPDCNSDSKVDIRDTACVINSIGGSTSSYTYTYDGNGNMLGGAGRTITYTPFNKPATISDGNASVRYTYGADRQRIKQTQSNDTVTTTTIYIGKLYEKIVKTGQPVTHKFYISAGSRLVAIHTKEGSNPGSITGTIHYALSDHLGSTDALVDASGTIERFSFDPFGQRRLTNWQETSSIDGLLSAVTTRGYTGHEMDDAVGLINMNARLYDPVIGRFITPDPTIPDMYNRQSLNRYSYVLNNPLSYTDITGYDEIPLYEGITFNNETNGYNFSDGTQINQEGDWTLPGGATVFNIEKYGSFDLSDFGCTNADNSWTNAIGEEYTLDNWQNIPAQRVSARSSYLVEKEGTMQYCAVRCIRESFHDYPQPRIVEHNTQWDNREFYNFPTLPDPFIHGSHDISFDNREGLLFNRVQIIDSGIGYCHVAPPQCDDGSMSRRIPYFNDVLVDRWVLDKEVFDSEISHKFNISDFPWGKDELPNSDDINRWNLPPAGRIPIRILPPP